CNHIYVYYILHRKKQINKMDCSFMVYVLYFNSCISSNKVKGDAKPYPNYYLTFVINAFSILQPSVNLLCNVLYFIPNFSDQSFRDISSSLNLYILDISILDLVEFSDLVIHSQLEGS